jgi:predicted PurR-regulated permease PerM
MLGEPPPPPAATQPATDPTTKPSTRPSALVKAVSAATAGPGGAAGIGGWFNRALQALIGVVVVLAAGIYLAATPRLYTNGLLHLVPKPHRAAAAELLCKIAYVLRHWMLGQLVPMAVIGTLTAIGLKLIGIEMWLIIGLLAALFNFIPNFGPLVSFVPAFLLALAADPSKAMWVVALWVVAQCLEGYVLTPLVQRRAVELPPALTILVQVLMGLLLGTLGVILAAPLAAAGMVVVQTLWVREALGDPVTTPDEDAGEDTETRRQGDTEKA